MKFTLGIDQLGKALGIVRRAVSNHPYHPMLGNILFGISPETGIVNLQGFDLSMGISINILSDSIEGNEPRKIAIPAQLLGNLVAKMGKSNLITFTLPDKSEDSDTILIVITSGSSNFTLSALENDDFPNIPFVTTEQGNFLPIAELINTPIGSLASIDETKQVLKGINFSFAEEGDRKTIRGMATDGHRLARHRISSICEAFTACTIPSKTITTVQYIANSLGHSRDIDVLLGATDVTFRIGGDAQLFSRILDGAYPNCEALIPKQFTNEVKINRGQVVTAVGILSNFSPNVSIKYRSGESTFLLSAQSDIGSGEQEISIEYNGIGDDEATLWFNSKYLLDALNLFDDEEISIYWNLPNTPVILQPESSDVLALVMPVQMPGR